MSGRGRSSGLLTPATRSRVAKQTSTPASIKSEALLAGSSPYAPVDLTDDSSSNPRKRKVLDYQGHQPQQTLSEALQSPTKKKKGKKEPGEKRCRRFRDKAPQTFHEIYDRAITQRFFVLDRQRTGTEDCPGERVELTGSTGNIYTVHIAQRITCDCPHCEKGNQCKHTIFVMKKVLNAPYNHIYQLALLSSELRDIFDKAPPINAPPETEDDDNGKRKPVEGDCPICYSELGETKESVVWCRAACGQNMHQECFETWARTRGSGEKVTCPMCRSVWEGKEGMEAAKVEKNRGVESEGYVNVADQLGISSVRDTSSYSEWFGRERGVGYGGGGRGRGGRGWRRW